MKRVIPVFLCICLFFTLASLSGCEKKDVLDPQNPVTLTMWHNFGGDMQQTMDALIDEFNATAGKGRGVIISVEAISSSAELQDALSMIINGDPGAPKMPDIVTAYPKTAIQFQSKGLLCDLDHYFSETELEAYIPEFVNEGRFGDNGLYVFPVAKSTEILFVNKTLFDRFAAATGVTPDCFSTFEGIAEAAAKYYAYSGGKQFYNADSWINLAQAGMIQQGANLFNDEKFALNNAFYKRIWGNCYQPLTQGGFAIYDGYSSDLAKTGDIVCSTGSSAGILFYGDSITLPDGTSEKAEFAILPYPVFDGGEKSAIQRGNGLMISKTGEKRETAAAVFIKWFTDPKQNMRFVAETGYLPVTEEAFENHMPQTIENADNPNIRQMLGVVTKMNADYNFFTAPSFDTFDGISKDYEKRYKTLLAEERDDYLAGGGEDQSAALDKFISELNQ